MKTTLTLLLIVFIFCNARCRKDKVDSNGLPPVTESGKNTLGFLLNGQPWTPKGFNGTANLSIDVDFGFKEGIFGISAYRIDNTNDRSYFGIGIRDSLNFLSIPASVQLTNSSIFVISFSDNNCSTDYYDPTIQRAGVLTITKLDKINRIIAGTFNATLSKTGCSGTFQITDGRFDMRY